jgi:hypothetical protein
MIENTYPELINKLACTCPAGALIQPAPLPSATINLGDIIADHARILSSFTSSYGMITSVIRMIACIIDVICALLNPFTVPGAVIRLFGTCLPDFILIFPQLAIPAIIICMIKIVLSIVEYVTETIIPIVDDIISNVEMLNDAFANDNEDAKTAIAFKIVSLFKIFADTTGILTAMIALWEMIKALLDLGVAVPCGGSGGSCDGCGDDQCPDTIKQSSISGTDGVLIVLYGSDPFDFELRFFSSSKQSDFLVIRDFFPKGFDYSQIKDEDDLPYVIGVDGNTYAVTGVDSGGTADLSPIQGEFNSDGFISSLNLNGIPYLDPLSTRFGTSTLTFNSSFTNRYIELQEVRQSESAAAANNGVWRIDTVYDAYNVLLKRSEDTWDDFAILNPAPHLRWKMKPSTPSSGGNKTFQVDINHGELLRHELIGIGCLPAVRTTIDGFNNRFPEASDFSLPELPDLDEVISDINDSLYAVAPASVDSQWVLDNYDHIEDTIDDLVPNVTSILNDFEEDMLDYVDEVYPKVFNKENSTITAVPAIQIVGHQSIITVTPIDNNGGKLSKGLPAGTIDVKIFATGGTLSSVTDVIDEYGATTGDFTATLIHDDPLTIEVTATVGGVYISDFNGFNLVPHIEMVD